MTRSQVTEIQLDEYGDETHESWILMRVNRVTQGPTGRRLFDSEILHQHYVMVEVSRCQRSRDLHSDHLIDTQLLFKASMSHAQWGAFVSSFGTTGVPATLDWLTGVGDVSQAPDDSRLAESFAEVRSAANASLEEIKRSHRRLVEAFEAGGKRAQREALRDLEIRLRNAPLNMEFAAKSLAEHAENVTTKMRSDVEAVARAMAAMSTEGAIELEVADAPQLDSGEDPEPNPRRT